MTSAHHEEVGRRVGAAGAGDSSSRGLRFGCPTRRGPRPARLSGPGVPRRNAAAAFLGAAETAPVDASPKRGPPTVAPECGARQPRLPTWKILGAKNERR